MESIEKGQNQNEIGLLERRKMLDLELLNLREEIDNLAEIHKHDGLEASLAMLEAAVAEAKQKYAELLDTIVDASRQMNLPLTEMKENSGDQQ